MLLREWGTLGLFFADLGSWPAWAWFALGLGTGVLLAPGVAAYAARRTRRRRLARRRMSGISPLQRRVDALEDNLAASLAAQESLRSQLDESQKLGLMRLRLLEAMAEACLPALPEMEQTLVDILAEREDGSLLDRRTTLGPLAKELRELSVLLRDLLILGRVEGREELLREEPVELVQELRRAAEGHAALVLEIDHAVPSLVSSDRGILGVALEMLATATDASDGAVLLHVGASLVRSGLHEITLEYRALPALDTRLCERLIAGGSSCALEAFVGAGRDALPLVIGARAIERLGGGLEIESFEEERVTLRVHLVLGSATDRRSLPRPVALPSPEEPRSHVS